MTIWWINSAAFQSQAQEQKPQEQDKVCQILEQELSWRYRSELDHEAVFLAIMGHQDDIAVGGPDEAGKL